jgi:hypothetical protein
LDLLIAHSRWFGIVASARYPAIISNGEDFLSLPPDDNLRGGRTVNQQQLPESDPRLHARKIKVKVDELVTHPEFP